MVETNTKTQKIKTVITNIDLAKNDGVNLFCPCFLGEIISIRFINHLSSDW